MTRVQRFLPWAMVTLGPILLFGPMLIRGQTLFWGTPLLQFAPWHQYALEILRGGHLPLWNPLLGTGAPLLANYQSGILYPPNALLALTGVGWGQGLLVLLHLAWAGAGMVVLGRRLGLNPLAQAVAGMAFGLSGALVARACFLSINAAAAWLPWIVAAADRLGQDASGGASRARCLKSMGWLSLALAFQWLAGHAQTSSYSLLLAVAWVSWTSYRQGRWAGFLRGARWFAGGAALAVLLAAIQLVPTAEYLWQSSRHSGLAAEAALTYSFWPWRALGVLMPDLFGSPASGDYWGYGNYWEDAIYVGVLPFVLAVIAGVRSLIGRGELRRLGRLLLGIAVVAVLLALGKNTPLYPFLFNHVPTFDLFQAPARWNLLTVFALALLAGMGANAWGSLTGRALYWARLGTAGAGALGLAAWFLAPRVAEIQPSFVRAFALAGLWLFLTGLLALLRPGNDRPAWGVMVAVVILADLVHAGLGLNPAAAASLYTERSRLASLGDDGHRLFLPADLEYELKFERFFRFDTFGPGTDWALLREAGLPNVTLLDGLPSANNFDPLLPGRFATWMETLGALPPTQQARLLALMDVGWLAVPDPGDAAGVRYERLSGASRVRVVPQAAWADSPEEALDLVLDAQFDPDQVVVLEDARAEPAAENGGGSTGRAEILAGDNPNALAVHVDAPGGGWLVLSDVWYPGWMTRLDGRPADLYRGDYLFRAVWVPAGEHTVEFEYEPASFRIGGMLSLVAWLALGWMAWRLRRA